MRLSLMKCEEPEPHCFLFDAAAAAVAAGSLLYMAPEVFREQPYSEKVRSPCSSAPYAAVHCLPPGCYDRNVL
jgi:hypothetical protein